MSAALILLRKLAERSRDRAFRVDRTLLQNACDEIAALRAALKAAPKKPHDFGPTLTLDDCATLVRYAHHSASTIDLDTLASIAAKAESTVHTLASTARAEENTDIDSPVPVAD